MGILTLSPFGSVFILMNKRKTAGCPTLDTDNNRAMEQILNAIILNNSDNISVSVSKKVNSNKP